jgi:RNA polymerase-binding transcription factor DksA
MDIIKQKQALLDLRVEYTSLLNATTRRDRSETQSEETAVDSDIPTHEADAGSVTFDRERDNAFVDDYRGALEQIDHALASIADGTYGKCEVCGRVIPDERLQAMPMASLCMDHAEG